jgi:hypothetical protein
MDADRFDCLTRTLITPGTRRGALGALMGGPLGLLGLAETHAARKRRRRQEQRRRDDAKAKTQAKHTKQRDKATAQGPCGNGSAKANTCTRHGQCCTGFCDKRKDRCRCKKLGASCTEDRNCCASLGQPMTCQNGACQAVASPPSPPPPPPPVTAECQPEPASQTCGGRCGIVLDNCGNPIDCGGCPICQSCAGGVCTAALSQQRAICAGSGATSSICCNGVCCDGCCEDGGVCGPCRVFATSGLYNGNLGGLTGADGTCRTHAMAGQLPGAAIIGNYKAWLSDDTGSPSSRFRRSARPYILPGAGGAQVADHWTDLTTCESGQCLDHAIDVDENGVPIPLPPPATADVWSNTTATGDLHLAAADCSQWATSDAGQFGALGISFETNPQWTLAGASDPCDSPSSHLYCFQQR